MKRYGLFFWLPMSVALLILWLLLNNNISLAQILLGFVLAVTLVSLSLRMRPDLAYPRHIWLIIKLTFVFLWDVLLSNLMVAKQILKTRKNQPDAGFVNIPLSIRDPHAVAFLACIVTYSPGTVWSGLTNNGYILRLHVLHLEDETYWVNFIKNRYEKPIMEIFEQ